MPERQTLLKDKPYEFVPLLEQCRRKDYNQQPTGERPVYSGKLRLKITVKSPLHIGSTQQEWDKTGNICKMHMRRNNSIIIPGSSLKGAVRSVAEAVSYSCAVKLPDNTLSCLLPVKNQQSCSKIDDLCMTCYIFGMMSESGSSRGHIRFGEFVLESGGTTKEKLPLLKSPFTNDPAVENENKLFNKEKNYGNERLYYCRACETGDCENCTKENYLNQIKNAGKEREMAFRGRKFYSTGKEIARNDKEYDYYEMIDRESVLRGEVLFQNLPQEECRLLAYALDVGHYFRMKLGRGKPLGYGKIQIDLESVESIGSRYPLMGQMDKALVLKWAKEYRENSNDEIKAAIGELERIMDNEKGSNITNSH